MYPILEFAADGSPRFQGWDGGAFVNYGLPSLFAYDAWHKLGITLDTSLDMFSYFLDDQLLGSVDAFGSVAIDNVILQGYNKFQQDDGSYDILWRNLVVGPDNNVPEPSSLALALLAGFGLIASRRNSR
jgi:hypothetical protein